MYKITMSFTKLSVAEKMYKEIQNSKIYNSKETVILNGIKEVCDECANKNN
jgi:hypothetical protein